MQNILKSYVPPFIREDPVMAAFYDAVAPELHDAKTTISQIPLQIWPHLATWGIARLEKVFGIQPDPGKPLESRRSVLLAKLRGTGTSTLSQIKTIAESYANGGVALTERFSDYTVDIEFTDDLGVPVYLQELKASLRAAIPAHLAISFILKWLTFDALKQTGVTWDELAATGVTWEQLKTYKEDE